MPLASYRPLRARPRPAAFFAKFIRCAAPARRPLAALALAFAPALAMAQGEAEAPHIAPGLVWALPFAALLLCIALLPLIPAAAHWWEHNKNKLTIALGLAAATCIYYTARGYGIHEAQPGLPTLLTLLHHAVLGDYVPFMVLLLSLYTISGGIRLSGDIPAHPTTNVFFLFLGGLIASFVGTTGASMLLIRPLLQINSERKRVTHTVIFFIFIVSNVGGALLPVGDPPLFLGYLRGVPFLWTLNLFPIWLTANAVLLFIYWLFDHYHYRHEDKTAIALDEAMREPIRLEGGFNFALLAGVVLGVALLVPGRPLLGTDFVLPNIYLREIVLLGLSGLSLALTSKRIRAENHFNFGAIFEVAALFIGIFITMQAPIELLQAKGAALGLSTPSHFFWASGALSSFLDNAPTYVVFFETAGSIPSHLANSELVTGLQTVTGHIPFRMLEAISLGSVFMGANTYIGNGPNFLVKSIAESRGVKMPSFFGYMVYSVLILIPLFVLLDLLYLIG